MSGRCDQLADEVVVANTRDPITCANSVTAAGGRVLRRRPGCEGGAIGGAGGRAPVIFFSMATSSAAALAPRASPPTCGCSSATLRATQRLSECSRQHNMRPSERRL